MSCNPDDIIDKYYPAGFPARGILLRHSRSVAGLAADINRRMGSPLPEADVRSAAMLHDIGIFLTDAPGIGCHGTEPYIRHGVLGADLLRREGCPEHIARVAERHTGAGIAPDDIDEMGLPLPADRDLMPRTLLERLICYADKFYSKSGDMLRKPLPRVRMSMQRHSPSTARRFELLHSEFGQYNPEP